MTTVALDLMLVVALGFVGLIATIRGTSGAGAVGIWLVIVPPVLLMLAALAMLIALGRFDWAQIPKWILSAAVPGVLWASAVSMAYLMDKDEIWWNPYAAAVSVVILLGLAVAAQPGAGMPLRVVSASILAPAALAGWMLLFYHIALIGSPSAVDPARQKQFEAYEAAEQAKKLADFRALGRDQGIEVYLGKAISGQLDILAEAREIIAGRPDRDERLAELLENTKYKDDAVTYIVNVYEKPSAKLALALRRVLETDLDKWRKELAGVSQPWARSISFQGPVIAGCKVQKNGGDLKKQLTAWRVFLVEMTGCDYLVKYIDEAIGS